MITRLFSLDDGREVRFRATLLGRGEDVHIKDGRQEQAAAPTVEIYSAASNGDPTHPEFLGARYLKDTLLDPDTVAAYSRRGLPLRGADRGFARLSPKDTVWLLSRLAADALDEVEVVRAPRGRVSALAD